MTIRIETDGASDLSHVYLWFARHRGQVVRLDDTKGLVLGTPISGPRAVIVAAVLQDDRRPEPRLGGVVRALSNRTDSPPVRLVRTDLRSAVVRGHGSWLNEKNGGKTAA